MFWNLNRYFMFSLMTILYFCIFFLSPLFVLSPLLSPLYLLFSLLSFTSLSLSIIFALFINCCVLGYEWLWSYPVMLTPDGSRTLVRTLLANKNLTIHTCQNVTPLSFELSLVLWERHVGVTVSQPSAASLAYFGLICLSFVSDHGDKTNFPGGFNHKTK